MPASNAKIYEMENKQLILLLCLYKRPTHKLHIYEKCYHKNVYHFIVVFFTFTKDLNITDLHNNLNRRCTNKCYMKYNTCIMKISIEKNYSP